MRKPPSISLSFFLSFSPLATLFSLLWSPSAQSRACRKSHWHPENPPASCTQEGMVGHHCDIKATHLRARPSQVHINNQKSVFLIGLFWFLWFSLLPCLFPNCTLKQKAQPGICQLWNHHPLSPTHAEDPGRVCFCSSWQRLMSLYHPKWQAEGGVFLKIKLL